jgi:catechol 2,3-dioxygenase-like lactoylglutathione lyase family enzyme
MVSLSEHSDVAATRSISAAYDAREALLVIRPRRQRPSKEDVMEWKLELIVVPVSDVDRAKSFYVDQLGFDLIVDHRAGEDFRVVQISPTGSACAIALMKNPEAAGSLQGLHLVVEDVEAARAELAKRSVEASEIFHFVDGEQQPGADPDHGDYNSFLSFTDPEGNCYLVQEVRRAS